MEGKSVEQARACKGKADGHAFGATSLKHKEAAKAGNSANLLSLQDEGDSQLPAQSVSVGP